MDFNDDSPRRLNRISCVPLLDRKLGFLVSSLENLGRVIKSVQNVWRHC